MPLERALPLPLPLILKLVDYRSLLAERRTVLAHSFWLGYCRKRLTLLLAFLTDEKPFNHQSVHFSEALA